MSETLRSAILSMLARVLDPLVKLLLEAGIGVGEFVTVVKTAYVRAAREAGRQAGGEVKRPNASRIAVVTGLTRLEVAAILAAGEGGLDTPDRGRQRAERVLAGWWNDWDFHDKRGEPAVLPVKGARRSFEALVRLYSGERWRTATILDELLRVKAVAQLPDGRLKAVSRTYATVRWDPAGFAAIGDQLAEHCETLLHNLKDPSHPLFVGRVVNTRIDPRWLPILMRDLRDSAQGFIESQDRTLNYLGHTLTGKASGKGATGAPVRLGVTLYVVEGVGDEESDGAPQDQAAVKGALAVRDGGKVGRRRARPAQARKKSGS
jgi:hypothetical protein